MDEIADPAGRAPAEFLWQRGVYGGTLFAFGGAGPPRGHAVYDRVNRIAYYSDGCCSWHHVVVASGVRPPPKPLASRSLAGLRTTSGIALGDPPAKIVATYGPAPLHATASVPHEQFLRYERATFFTQVYAPCDATTTFVFANERLVHMDFAEEC